MLTHKEIQTLSAKLPADWVKKVKELTGFSESKIRQSLRNPKPQDIGLLETITDVANKYQEDLAIKTEDIKNKINYLKV